MTLEHVLVIAAFGILTGVLSGLLGVGGGIVMVPLLVLYVDTGQHVAEGTSLLVIIPTAVAGAITHARRGFVSWRIAMLLALGGMSGAAVGAYLALLTPSDVLTRFFAAFLLVIGVRLILAGRRTRRARSEEEATD